MVSTKIFGIITLKKLYFGEIETPYCTADCYPVTAAAVADPTKNLEASEAGLLYMPQ